jgi:hypothetical protein
MDNDRNPSPGFALIIATSNATRLKSIQSRPIFSMVLSAGQSARNRGSSIISRRGTAMITNNCEPRLLQRHAIRTLVDKARAVEAENRSQQRFPFFQPVAITAEHDGTVSLSAFSRDISEDGIGLLLYFPVRLRFVHLKVYLNEDESLSLTGYVKWCQPCGNGWYVAGVTFDEERSDEVGYASGLHLT